MKPLTHRAHWRPVLAGSFMLGCLIGCSSAPPQEDASWRLVPMGDATRVVGEWEGTIHKERNVLPGSVHLSIRDNGTYLFAGQHATTMAVGSGFLEPRDGRLIGDTDRRAITFALYDHDGKAILWVEATSRATGDRYHGRFTKVEESKP